MSSSQREGLGGGGGGGGVLMVFMGEPSNTHRVKKLERMRILPAHTFFCEITITFLFQEARNKNLT